jgi:signal transduction histidine kinase
MNPPDSELMKWGWARAGMAGARGLAWSLGPILIYTSNDTISLVIPVWGIINLMAASAYTAAPFFPCLIAIIVGGIIPAATWMAFQEVEAARLSALLLLLSIPFIGFVGRLGRRNIEALIAGRLDLAENLDKQRQQTRIVEQALAERTRFFSAASHDLRQPLQALGFYASLLATKRHDDSYEEIVSRLEECVGNLDRQFNAILGIAETDSLVRRAKIVATPLARVLGHVAASIRPEAEARNLRVRIVPTRLWAMVAPELLERILINLAANAVRYTAVGGILLGVRRRAEAVEIWVVDTGIGIPEEHRQNIFDEYYQIGNSAREPDHGFGLGLAIARRLCIGMKWPIDFLSVVNRGSGFKVSVPITTQLPEEPMPEALQISTTTPRIAVLVVDDDPLVRDAMKRLIASWGLRVETCLTGDQAIHILQARDTSFRWEVLVDYRLSGSENGLMVVDRLRHIFGRSVGLALITAETDGSIFEQAAERAMVILRKPIKPVRLRAILTKSAMEGSGRDSHEAKPTDL